MRALIFMDFKFLGKVKKLNLKFCEKLRNEELGLTY